MPTTITSIVKNDNGTWTYTYTGTAPFRRYLDGILIDGGAVSDTSVTVQSNRTAASSTRTWSDFTTIGSIDDTEEPPPVEIFDATETGDAQNELHSPRITLQWRGNAQADYYVVRRYVTSSWEDVTIIQETGRGYYTYTSPPLTDQNQEQYRVVPVDAAGTEGAVLPYSAAVVRNPSPPRVTISYDSGTNTITASARA